MSGVDAAPETSSSLTGSRFPNWFAWTHVDPIAQALNAVGPPASRSSAPYKRNSTGDWVAVDWDTALREFTGRMKEIQWRCGKQSVAIACPGHLSLEESLLMHALAEQGMGISTVAVDLSPSVRSALVAYERSLGSCLPPYTLNDLDESHAVVLFGSSVIHSHPGFWERFLRNPHSPELIVIDPRLNETAQKATLHIPARPGTETVLILAVTRILIENDWIDVDFISGSTSGFEEFSASLAAYDKLSASRICGVPVSLIEQFAEILHGHDRISFWWSTTPQSHRPGMETATINLALATGNLCRPGTGANALFSPFPVLGSVAVESLSSRANSSGTASAAPVRLDFPNPSWADIRAGIRSGKIKGLWVIATNALTDWQSELADRELLSQLDYLVVQGCSDAKTGMPEVDLFLPSAYWGEKSGSVLTSDRRLANLPVVQSPPHLAQADFEIFQQIASYWNCRYHMESKWGSREAVFNTLREAAVGTPLDFSGVASCQELAAQGEVHLPFGSQLTSQRPDQRLYEDRHFETTTGLAHFVPADEFFRPGL